MQTNMQRRQELYTTVKIVPQALAKMTEHTLAGGDLEVMGVMTGFVDATTFYVLDSVALPVEGTETRVNAGEEANEFLVDFCSFEEELGNAGHAIGWYHSHPGYRCWLSSIDVATQRLYQQGSEPWVAVVIDPHMTKAQSQIDIGAFRTVPEGFIAPSAETQGLHKPSNGMLAEKLRDFGSCADSYYPMAVELFCPPATFSTLAALGVLNGESTAVNADIALRMQQPVDIQPLLARLREDCSAAEEESEVTLRRRGRSAFPPSIMETLKCLELVLEASPHSVA